MVKDVGGGHGVIPSVVSLVSAEVGPAAAAVVP